MKKFTHAWIAFKAIERLQKAEVPAVCVRKLISWSIGSLTTRMVSSVAPGTRMK